MRRFLTYAAAGLCSILWLGVGDQRSMAKEESSKVCTTGTCGNYGTAVQFVKTPSEAARQALKEEKLVFVLHISGLFENPEFT